MEESATFYLDANVFIYAIVNSEEIGNKSRGILDLVTSEKIKGVTSCLTFDEILWIIRKIKQEATFEAGDNLLNLKVRFIEANKLILFHALDIIKEYNLKPRDAIHAATMKVHNIKNLISEDADFDKIGWIKRKSIKEF